VEGDYILYITKYGDEIDTEKVGIWKFLRGLLSRGIYGDLLIRAWRNRCMLIYWGLS
jgi:hypothetical protein